MKVKYVDSKEDITSFKEYIDLYFAASYVENDNEVSKSLSVIRADANEVFRNLLAPQRPKEKSFDKLNKALIGHCSSKPILIAER